MIQIFIQKSYYCSEFQFLGVQSVHGSLVKVGIECDYQNKHTLGKATLETIVESIEYDEVGGSAPIDAERRRWPCQGRSQDWGEPSLSENSVINVFQPVSGPGFKTYDTEIDPMFFTCKEKLQLPQQSGDRPASPPDSNLRPAT